MINFFFKLISLIFFIFFCSNLLADEKIAFIDINLVFNETLFGKDFNKQIKIKSDNLDIKIKNFQLEIENENKDLLNKKNVLSDDEYNLQFQKIDNKIKNYDLLVKKDQDALEKYKIDVRNEFFKNLLPLLESYLNEQSIKLIIKKETLIIAKNNLDVTNDIITMFNKKISKVKTN